MHLRLRSCCVATFELVLILLLSRSTHAVYATTEVSSLTYENLPALQGTANMSHSQQLVRRLNESPESDATRPVWLYFRAPFIDPPPTHPRIAISIGIGAGNVPGASVGTIIELNLFRRLTQSNDSSEDSNSSEFLAPRNVYQVIYGQFREPIQGASDAEPVSVAEYTQNRTLITRYYLGTTAITDHQILDPESGEGAILDTIRGQPKITPMATRSEFMQELLNYLYIHYSEQYYSDFRDDVSGMFEQVTSNDAWNIQHGTSHNVIFPSYRIPFILNVKGNNPTRIDERMAYVTLDIGTVDNPGLSWSIRATPPDRNLYERVLDYFLHNPDWNGLEGLDEVVAIPGFFQTYVKYFALHSQAVCKGVIC